MEYMYSKSKRITLPPNHVTHPQPTANITIPQIPQSSSSNEGKDTDDENPLPCPPPVNACTSSVSEPSDPFIGIGVGSAKCPVPFTSNVLPPSSRLTTAPEIVMPDAPALSVTPSTTTKEGCDCVSIWKPSMIVISDEDEKVAWGVRSGIVLEPRSSVPDGWRVMIVPSSVTAGPPAEIVVPAMENAEGLGVNVWSAMV